MTRTVAKQSSWRRNGSATVAVVIVASLIASTGDRPAVAERTSKPPAAERSVPLPGGDIIPLPPVYAGGPTPASDANDQLLDQPIGGQAAIAGLGAELPEAAARNELSATELTDVLLTDDGAVLDTTGRLFYAEGPVDTTGLEPAVAEAGPYPYGDTFLLHSKPTATRKIFLDFDGHTVTGTQWQSDFPALADPFVALPFSTDADPVFSNAELDAIQSIWQRVAEDFAPYDIDVTTQDPGAAGINRASSGDVNFGTRVLITDSPTFGAISTTGIAYVGTIDAIGVNHDRTQPAWVFANGVGDDTKNIAETASHEAGHNVGLLHDGEGLFEYYSGHTPWAPIMGAGFSQPIVQFSKGEYSGASRTEDDLLVIAQNSVPSRVDDHTNNTSTATPLVDAQVGVISSQADYDAFAYVATATGPVTITASPAPVSPNLDIVLSVFDSVGGDVASSAPAVTRLSRDVATGMDASVTFDAAAGSTYYAQVGGDAFQTPSTGFSRYGSIGQYTVTLAGAPPSSCPPDDAREDNDTSPTATVVLSSAPLGGRICANDDDWFRFRAVAGETLTVDAQFVHATGDLDLALYSPTGGQVATSESDTDDELISFVAPRTGLYAVRVYGLEGAENTYELTISSPLCAPDDPLEENDLTAAASPLPLSGSLTAVACPNDSDYFAMPAAAGSTIDVGLAFNHAFGDLDMVLRSPGGQAVAIADSTTDDESITHVASQSGAYTLQVAGYDGASNVYDLVVTVTPPSAGAAAWPDFDGNGRADRSVFRPSSGGWHVEGATTTYLGLSGDDPVPADYDGDGTTDRAVFRNGQWYIAGQPTRYLGALGDIPVPGDFDGDGTYEPAVYRDGAWFIEGQPTRYLGTAGDVPVPGDYDGDRTTDLAVYRPAVGGWYVDGAPTVFFGLAGDVPVPGDYDGDGGWDRAVFRPQFGGWYVEGQTTQYLGLDTDTPTPSDYDGDGVTDRGVYRPAVGGWYVADQPTTYLGLSTDTPLALPNAIVRSIP